MEKVEGLSLYHYAGCGWCGLVQSALTRLGVEVEQCDILDEPGHMRALVEATGRQTVPCLRIREDGGDRWMHESSDIIAYLNERFAGSA